MNFLRPFFKRWAMVVGAAVFSAAVALAAAAQTAPEASPPTRTTAEGVVDLILHHQPELHSYAAHAVLDIQQINFPYLHPILDGQVYYQAPGYTVYNFPNTPSYLQGITRAEGAMGMATRWMHCYDITLHSTPDAYQLHMVPKIRGEVAALDVTVRRDGDLQHFVWSYHDPNDSISLTQLYRNVGGYDVVTAQQSDITRHHIRAKLTGTFDSFRYNVPVPTPTPTPSNPLHQCDN